MQDFISQIEKNVEKVNIIEKLRESGKPVIVWGCGSMSVSVTNLLNQNGIVIAAYWADNSEEGQAFRGKPVLRIQQVATQFGRINVVLGHSRYELAMATKDKYDCIDNIYCLTDVCYGQWDGFGYDTVWENRKKYEVTYDLLCDELSRQCMVSYFNCKISENYKYIVPCCSQEVSYFANPFFKINENENFVDVGAYNGDTIGEFLRDSKGIYENIYAFEPEEKNFREMQEYVKSKQLSNVLLYQYGCWNCNTTLYFSATEESSSLGGGGESIQVVTLDSALKDKAVSMIKINFLHGVKETLLGAGRILKEQKPKLIVTVGFDEKALIDIPQIVKQINPEYKIALRYAAAMPARLIMFAW